MDNNFSSRTETELLSTLRKSLKKNGIRVSSTEKKGVLVYTYRPPRLPNIGDSMNT